VKKILCLLLFILLAGCLSQETERIQSIEDLEGKTIAIPGKATVQDFLLQRFLTDNNITVNVVIVKPPEMIAVMEKGEIDGFIAWEPYPGRAFSEGHTLLVTSHDIWPHHPCCVVAVREQYYAENPDVTLAVLAAHVKATTFIREHPEEAIDIGVEFTGMPREVVAKAMETIEFVYEPNYEGIKEYVQALLDMEYVSQDDVGDVDTFLGGFINTDLIQDAVTFVCTKQIDKTVRIGYLKADLHQLALFVAKKQGYFDEFGLNIELYVFSAGPEEMDAFGSQDIDMGYLGIAPATTKRLNLSIPIIIIGGVNNEGSAIVVR
jgi:NitT/TauT family transport system substrate-binding protein